jgi:hypothetical protein
VLTAWWTVAPYGRCKRRSKIHQCGGRFPFTAFSCSAGIAFSGRYFSGRPKGLALTGRAPCYDLAEAVPIIGMVLVKGWFLAAAIVARQGPRPAASGQAGLGRAANARRAAERGPRLFGEEPPKAWLTLQ